MQVSTSKCPGTMEYYQVRYRQFADSDGVSTFDPADPATGVLTMLQHSGDTDPIPAPGGTQTVNGTFALAPGASRTLRTFFGSGELTALQLQIPQLAQSDTALSGLRLRISFDGKQTVDTPLGEFFGAAGGPADVRSLLTRVDPSPGGRLTSWWPMPYGASAAVSLYNGSDQAISAGQYSIQEDRDEHWATDLSDGSAGYFRTQSVSGRTVPGQDWDFLRATGHGKLVGISIAMRGPTSRWYLEGNDRSYLDGLESPQLNGTGTEDLFQSGWYFLNGPVTNPLTGSPSHELTANAAVGDCPANTDCTAAYRLMPADASSFDNSIVYGIEHGDTDHTDATYSSTAFWYGQDAPASQTADTLVVGDAASEAAHAYTSSDPGTAITGTSSYEGQDGTPIPLTMTTRSTNAPVSFTMTVNPDNQGVDLQRTSDQSIAYQTADVWVDGMNTGQWQEPLANPTFQWLDDSYQLPASITAGRSTLSITLVPLPSGPAWNAAKYTAISRIG